MKKIAALMKQTAALLIFGLSLFCLWQGAKFTRAAEYSRASSAHAGEEALSAQREEDYYRSKWTDPAKLESLDGYQGVISLERIQERQEWYMASVNEGAARSRYGRALAYFLISGGLLYWSRKPRAVAALEQRTV